MSCLKHTFFFFLILAVLLFVGMMAQTIRNDGRPTSSERLDAANEAISDMQSTIAGLEARNDQLLELIGTYVSEAREAAQLQAKGLEAQLGELAGEQEELGDLVQEVLDLQRNTYKDGSEEWKMLADRLQSQDRVLSEVAARQKALAESHNEVLRKATSGRVGTVDLGDIGRALSERMELVMKNRQVLTDEQKQKLRLLKSRQSQLNGLIYDQESRMSPYPRKKRDLDEKEKTLAETYTNEIFELEREVGGLEIKTPSSFDGSDRAIRLILDVAERDYRVVFNRGFHGREDRVLYHDIETPVIDLTPQIIQMIHQLEDDDPILKWE